MSQKIIYDNEEDNFSPLSEKRFNRGYRVFKYTSFIQILFFMFVSILPGVLPDSGFNIGIDSHIYFQSIISSLFGIFAVIKCIALIKDIKDKRSDNKEKERIVMYFIENKFDRSNQGLLSQMNIFGFSILPLVFAMYVGFLNIFLEGVNNVGFGDGFPSYVGYFTSIIISVFIFYNIVNNGLGKMFLRRIRKDSGNRKLNEIFNFRQTKIEQPTTFSLYLSNISKAIKQHGVFGISLFSLCPFFIIIFIKIVKKIAARFEK